MAIASYTKQRELAQRFIDYLLSPEGQKHYKKYNYFATAAEAVAYIGEDRPVGGEYVVPQEWLTPANP